MTNQQRLFLIQARSDFEVVKVLTTQHPQLPSCHALHYLQMATELLSKAHQWKYGPPSELSHLGFVSFLRSLRANRRARIQFGFKDHSEAWEQLLRKNTAIAERVESLAPAVAGDGPNPEYPWPRSSPKFAPAETPLPVWEELQRSPIGRQFMLFVEGLFEKAESFL